MATDTRLAAVIAERDRAREKLLKVAARQVAELYDELGDLLFVEALMVVFTAKGVKAKVSLAPSGRKGRAKR
jgi:hypothetical protein